MVKTVRNGNQAQTRVLARQLPQPHHCDKRSYGQTQRNSHDQLQYNGRFPCGLCDVVCGSPLALEYRPRSYDHRPWTATRLTKFLFGWNVAPTMPGSVGNCRVLPLQLRKYCRHDPHQKLNQRNKLAFATNNGKATYSASCHMAGRHLVRLRGYHAAIMGCGKRDRNSPL
jgi:hypothetical protein